jgi:hypothetical protein
MMMNFTVMPQNTTYAKMRNGRFSNTSSNIRSIEQRWKETYNSLPKFQQQAVDVALEQAKSEFRRRNPNLRKWVDVSNILAEAKSVIMTRVQIDSTMQRQLDIEWVLTLLNRFMATMVVPIQVYRPNKNSDEFLAWDGQHTLVLLWLIATQIMEVDPETIEIPVNVYASKLKAEMRANFISLNSKEGKKVLEAIDLWDQMVYGVRVDASENPDWIKVEAKQQVIEAYSLFVTSNKFGDTDQAGAISRLQEINKLDVATVSWLCHYLAAAGATERAVAEKEIVMMAYFFDKCRLARNVTVDAKFIIEVASVTKQLWEADFSPTSVFWTKASNAYANWHSKFGDVLTSPRFNKEPIHGFPFLIEQLKKELPERNFPNGRTNSEFYPDAEDLF